MSETRVDIFRHEVVESVRLTHLPTGIVTEGKTRDEAIRKLGERLSDEHPCQFGPLSPILPVPVGEHEYEDLPEPPEPHHWKYRVC